MYKYSVKLLQTDQEITVRLIYIVTQVVGSYLATFSNNKQRFGNKIIY